MAKMNIKKGDKVKVIAGKDRGAEGVVIKSYPSNQRVAVEGINIVKKAQRPTQANPQGGIASVEAPIHVSNVQLVCPACGEATRVSNKRVDGKKVRVCKKCGKDFD
ncbi:MAG: 50S ribosomal protein L24 [Coriobacteriia bacterium]|nr:50S ribosomal protein L24 [Coriobacteriia bacterium]